MDVSQHPEFDRILEAMKICQGSAWTGIAYRSASPRYASGPDLVSGVGSRRYGARWNPKGAFLAVYVSLDLETAMAEDDCPSPLLRHPGASGSSTNLCRHRV